MTPRAYKSHSRMAGVKVFQHIWMRAIKPKMHIIISNKILRTMKRIIMIHIPI